MVRKFKMENDYLFHSNNVSFVCLEQKLSFEFYCDVTVFFDQEDFRFLVVSHPFKGRFMDFTFHPH